MGEGLIVRRSLGVLRQAAEEGRAYYSCEQFEDTYGRLLVGVGARLEGRALRAVARTGRKSVQVSPVALCDGVGFRRAIRKADRAGRESSEDGVGIGQMFQAVSRVHPEAAKRILKLGPRSRELAHGMRVGKYVRRLMVACNKIRRERPYSNRDLMSGFMAGVVHDMGCWGGRPAEGHALRGALLLTDLARDSTWLQDLAGVVEHHHSPFSGCVEDTRTLLAPVVLAEAVLECSGSPEEAVRGLVCEAVPARDVLIGLCHLERCFPPLAVVRIRHPGPGLRCDLAVSLQAEDSSGPYLLRFARLDARGRPRPVPLEYRCLIGPSHPDYAGCEPEVVDLLPRTLYDRLFKGYEGLIPVFQRVLSKS